MALPRSPRRRHYLVLSGTGFIVSGLASWMTGQIDRDGDPDDLVNAVEAARMLRYANHHVIHANPPPWLLPRTGRLRSGPQGPRRAAVEAIYGLGGCRRPLG
jgi:hypothetical protein